MNQQPHIARTSDRDDYETPPEGSLLELEGGMKKQKTIIEVRAKDGTAITVEGDRMGCFVIHQVPGSNWWNVSHERSGLAVVQSIKGVLRARKMAAALLSYDLSDEFRSAQNFSDLLAALKAMPAVFQVWKEFDNKAANSEFDPSLRERKAVQMPLFGAV